MPRFRPRASKSRQPREKRVRQTQGRAEPQRVQPRMSHLLRRVVREKGAVLAIYSWTIRPSMVVVIIMVILIVVVILIVMILIFMARRFAAVVIVVPPDKASRKQYRDYAQQDRQFQS